MRSIVQGAVVPQRCGKVSRMCQGIRAVSGRLNGVVPGRHCYHHRFLYFGKKCLQRLCSKRQKLLFL